MQLDRYVEFTGYIPKKELAEVLTTADICINPEYANEFTDKSTMIKVMEYMTFGKPIIQFYTKEGEVTAGEAAIYIRENSTAKFADAIIDLLEDSARRKEMGEIGRYRISEMFGWAIQKQRLREAYKKVLPG
jgi:glycosyltransferase involved in cell wall biosynthesis